MLFKLNELFNSSNFRALLVLSVLIVVALIGGAPDDFGGTGGG